MPPHSLRRANHALFRGLQILRGAQSWGLVDRLRATIADPPDENLAATLLHARANVPYYRKLFGLRGISEEMLSSAPRAALARLPVLTKRDLSVAQDELKSETGSRRTWRINTSGGSTGEPARFVQDARHRETVDLAAALCHERCGFRPHQREVRLWGAEREVLAGSLGFHARISNYLCNRTFLNAFAMSPDRMRSYLAFLNEESNFVIAYAQAAYSLACFAHESGIEVRPQVAVVSSAGTLYPFLRQAMTDAFRAPVYNRYGSREVGLIATEVPDAPGLWVPPWTNYVEILDDSNQPVPIGTEGNVVVTNLSNQSMPLIRYAIGDRGALLPPDRSGQQWMAAVLGRNVDMFRRVDGGLVDGEYFTHLLYHRQWVKQFQFVQRAVGHVQVRLVTHSEPPQYELEEIAAGCRAALGLDCSISFEQTDSIAPGSSGKYRYTICEVSSDDHD